MARKKSTTGPARGADPVPRAGQGKAKQRISAHERHRMIQEAAYLMAEKAGFNGDCMEYWLAAEREVEKRLNGD